LGNNVVAFLEAAAPATVLQTVHNVQWIIKCVCRNLW